MPELQAPVWWLIGAAVVVVVILLAVALGRRQRDEEHRIRRSQTVRVILAVLLLGLIALFAAVNAHRVVVDWVLAETQAPMVVVIALSGGVGFLVGALIAYRSRAS